MIPNTIYIILVGVAQFKLGSPDQLGLPDVSADPSTLQTIFNTIFMIAGALSVIFMIYGGISYALSAGNPEKAKRAWETLLYSAIGLVISISAVALITFVIGRFN